MTGTDITIQEKGMKAKCLGFCRKAFALLSLCLVMGAGQICAQEQNTLQGRDFWVGFLHNGHCDYMQASGSYTYANITNANVRSLIANSEYAGTVNVSCGAWSTTVALVPGGSVQINIPYEDNSHYVARWTRPCFSRQVRPAGIHVTSTVDISLYALNYMSASFDATAVLPTRVLGTHYYPQDFLYPYTSSYWAHDYDGAEFCIVATEDNTTVNITFGAAIQIDTFAFSQTAYSAISHSVHGAGTSFRTLTMQQGDYIQLMTPKNFTFSGTEVTSNKPVAVFMGRKYCVVPHSRTSSGTSTYAAPDHIYEQALSTDRWGQEFLVVPDHRTGGYGDYLDVISLEDGCSITATKIDGTIYNSTTVQAGEHWPIRMPDDHSPLHINATHSVSVCLFLGSYGFRGNMGDPSSVVIPPLEQATNRAAFNAYSTSNSTVHRANIVVPSDAVSGMRLDGSDISSQFSAFGTTGLSYAKVPVTAGSHVLSNNVGRFNAWFYGMGNMESYAYTAAMGMRNLQYELFVDGDDSHTWSDTLVVCQNTTHHFKIETEGPIDTRWLVDDAVQTSTDTTLDYTFASPGYHRITALQRGNCSAPDFCDTLRLVFHVLAPVDTTVHDTISATQLPYTWNGTVFETATVNHTATLSSVYGCDSVVHYNLHVWAASCGDTTVANGTAECLHSPLYGMHGDFAQRVQSIYQPYLLTHLVGKTVDSLHYYLEYGSSTGWGTENWTISVGTATRSNLYGGFDNDATLTQVYSGPLVATSSGGMGIRLDTPFTYTGGRLLIQFTKANGGGYSSCVFLGETPDYVGATRWATTYNGGNVMTLTGTSDDQLPKVTFHHCSEGTTLMPEVDASCGVATVSDGTTTNNLAPVNGASGSTMQRSQSIYPVEMLTNLIGRRIDSLHYYVASGSSSGWGNGDWTVSMGVTRWSIVYAAFDNTTVLTPVYHGPLTADATGGMGVKLDSTFAYAGGNLIVQFVQNSGSGNSACSFYGSYVYGGSRYSTATSGNIRNVFGTTTAFLPKVSFHACADPSIDTSHHLNGVALPYCENFDNYPAGEGNMPLYWAGYNTFNWDVGRFPYVRSGSSHSPYNTLCMRSWTTNRCYAVFPNFALDSIQQLNISFYLKRESSEGGMLVIGVLTDSTNMSTFIPLDTVLLSTRNQWTPVNFSFSGYHGTAQRGAFLNLRAEGDAGNLYIDDFIATATLQPTIEQYGNGGARAVLPSGMTADYWLEYGAQGFLPGTDPSSLVHVTSNPYYITNLSPGTVYDFYAYPYVDNTTDVRGTCNNPITVTTPATCIVTDTVTITVPPTVMPYSYNGISYAVSGTYTQEFTATNGCDSILTVIISNNCQSTIDTTVTACDSYMWHGHTYTATGNYNDTITNVLGCDSVVTLHLTVGERSTFLSEGALPMPFSVSATQEVYFSRGNLQFQASTNTWRFAEHQYDYVGSGNSNVSATYSGWIDLFAWGCSGWNSGAIVYQPYATDNTASHYYPTGSGNYHLTDSYSEADWAWHNVISNGGNEVHAWRTLTRPEWIYLLSTRTTVTNLPTVNARFTRAIVSGINGIILFPNNYNHPDGVAVPTNINVGGAPGNPSNNYTAEQWNAMETAGAVFLPAAGYRTGTTIMSVNTNGYYWTATRNTTFADAAFSLAFSDGSPTANVSVSLQRGFSVRPVTWLSDTHDTFATVCNSIFWHGHSYTVSGNYNDTLTNVTGCDSIVTLNLTVNHSNTGTDVRTACNSYTWIDGNTYTASNSTATHTLTNTAGCDSVVTLNLTVNYSIASTDIQTACDSYTWTNGVTYTTSNSTATQTLTNAIGCDSVVTLQLTVNHSNTGTDIQTACDSYTWIDGNTYTATTNTATHTLTNSVGCDSVVTLNLTVNHGSSSVPEGATQSLFSIGADNKVHFSRGNLQYQASTGTWRFAEHQYDVIGSSNSSASSTYSGWIDLFGWGTSGWNSGAVAYEPYSISTTNSDYYPGGSYTNDLEGDYAEADWAWHNAITGGGNQTHLWRTMSSAEWTYLLNTRATTTNLGTVNARYAKAQVNGKHGLIVFPDEYTHPSEVPAPVGINQTGSSGWNGNSYTVEQWGRMEAAGAVFLPTTGIRIGTIFDRADTYGYYSSTTHGNENYAKRMCFASNYITTQYDDNRANGYCVRPIIARQFDTIAEVCDSLVWHGTTYTASGVYVDTMTNVAGCDSVVTLQLTVNHSDSVALSYFACESIHWIDGYTYTVDTTLRTVLHTTHNCDSIVNLRLSVLPTPTLVRIPDTVVESGQPVTLYAHGANIYSWYTASGTSFSSDSTVIVTPTIPTTYYLSALSESGNMVNNGDFELGNTGFITNYTYNSNNVTGNASYMIGTNAHNYHNDFLCDHDHTNGTGNFMIINGSDVSGTIVWQQTVQIQPQTDYAFSAWVTNLSNYAQQYMAQLQFSINGIPIGDIFQIPTTRNMWSQFYQLWNSGDTNLATITILNMYTNWLGNDFGIDDISFSTLTSCPALDSVNVLIGHRADSTICDNQLPLLWNNVTFTQAGIRTATLTAFDGSDSIVIMHLAVKNTSASVDVQEHCNSYTWIDGNSYTASNNTATFVLPNAVGCDSTVTLNLTVNYSNTGVDVQTDCDSYTWIDGNGYTSSNSTATHTLTNAAGCDSVVTLNLTINYSNAGTDVRTACDSYSWIDGNSYTSSTSTATHTLTNVVGCDSVVTLNLTVNYSNTGTDIQTACDSYSWIDGNIYTTSNGTATHTLTNIAGCDSVVTLNLTVNHSNTVDSIAVVCDSLSWHGTTYTISINTPTHTYTSAAGCDSIVRLNLTVNHSNHRDTTAIVCDSITWRGVTYEASADTAFRSFTNVAGCDSTITLILTVNYSDHSSPFTSAGATRSLFTISTGTAIRFSRGNLQYTTLGTHATADGNTAIGTWRFAEHQYDYIGESNLNKSETYTGWLDLFGNGTSGKFRMVQYSAYQPFMDGTYLGSAVSGYYRLSDWAVYNAISNGGNIPDTWRTLEKEEWRYLLHMRHGSTVNGVSDARFAKAVVAGVNGLIIFPDSYTHPAGIQLPQNINVTNAAYNANTYTAQDWEQMEWAGTVFLPAAGYRYCGVPEISYLNTEGWYWTASECSGGICYAHFNTSTITPQNYSSWVPFSGTYTYCNHMSVRPIYTGTDYTTPCDTVASACNQFTWYDSTYTLSTDSATHTFTNSVGCDSVVTMHLTVNHSNTGTDVQTACNSFSWIDGNIYSSSTNTPTHTLTNIAGCDSVVTLNLTVNHSNTGTDVRTACDSYTWIDGNTYTASNSTATHTLTNVAGCDSVVTLNLTVNYSNTGIETITACNSYVWHGTEYSSSTNTPTYTCLNTAGCDSVTTLHLTVNHCSTTTITACDSYTWYGSIYTVSDTYIIGTDTLILTVNHSSTGTDIRTACDSYTWIDGNTYTVSNSTATHTLTNAAGCDSVVTLNLTVNYSNTSTDVRTACDSYTWIDGNIYTASNSTATRTLTNAAGCDSTVTLNLTVNYRNTYTDIQTACDSYYWTNGVTYTASNSTATQTLTNAAGCDSTVTLNLTINYSNASTDVRTACDSYTWIDGNTYTASNSTATQLLTNVAGCDSVVTLNLTVNYSSTGIETITACNSYVWHGTEYTGSTNTPTYTCLNTAGCDSVTTLHLTVNHCSTTTITACDSYTWHGSIYTVSDTYIIGTDTLILTVNHSNTGTDVQTACNSYTWIDGNSYTSSNSTATHTLTNVAGCDSTVTLNLTINYSNTGTDVRTACDSYTWIDGNSYTSSTSTATHTLTNVVGCDSVVTLNLTVNYSNTGTDVQTACNSYTWIDGNNYTTSNGAATHTLTNVAGCDSIVTLALTVNYSNTGTDVQTACNSYTWIDGNTYTVFNSTATQTLTNVAGCDSVVTLNLTVNYSNTGVDVQTDCDSYTWIDGNDYMSSNSTATHTLTNAAGCDSVVTLNLTINYSNAGTDVRTACDSYTWIDGITYNTSNSTATHTLTNVVDCDSVVTLNLIINHSNTGTDVQSACNTYSWIDGNTYTASNSTATQTLTNAAGCDSVVTLNLIVNYSNTGTDIQTACDSYTWIDGNTYTASNSTATHTLTNVAGCDSVVTLNLTVNYSNTGIETITACNSYVWHGTEYTNSTNTPTFICLNVAGCDSVTTLNLTVNECSTTTITACDSYTWHGNSYTVSDTYIIGTDTLILTINHSNTGTDVQTVCDSYTWIDGNTYTVSNSTATSTLSNAVGCDSIVTLNLTISYSNIGTDVQTACDSYTWIDGNIYTASNSTATHSLTNVIGCDSVVTLNLTVNYSNAGTDVQTACDSYTWTNGVTYTASETLASQTLTNAAGCDSTVTLNLTINYSNAGTDIQAACDSYSWIDGNTYTASNSTATQMLTNVAGCDSTVTLSLTVNYSKTGTDVQTACDSYTWIDGNTYTASNSIATQTLTNVAGCDSVVTLNLTVNYSNTGIETITACNSYVWHGTEYTNSTNTPTYTCPNTVGCDSVTTLHLTVNYCSTTTITACDSYTWHGNIYTVSDTYIIGTDTLILTINHSNTGTDVQTACDSYPWINGSTYTSSNSTATHTLTNAAGCDSVVTLNLTINYSNAGTDVRTACDSYTWIDGITYTASETLAYQTLTNAAGCDSVVTLNLTVNYSNAGTDIHAACDSYSWIDGNTYTASNSTATQTLTNAAGCDSTVTLNLTLNHSNSGTDVYTVCDSYTWIDGNAYTSSNSTATHTLTNVAGCDSIITLNLTVNYSNTGVETITACNSYVWHGTEYTNSTNTPIYTCPNTVGCDSVTTLHLTVNECSTTTITACDSYTWHGNSYTASDTYIIGTDTLILTINHSSTGIDLQTACDSLVWHGNTYTTGGTAIASYLTTNAVGCDSLVTLDLILNLSSYPVFTNSGATNSVFSVSASSQVRFSRGNLQYQASTDTWRFAEHQYDVISNGNANISSTYNGWIDLFGWGTSGWNNGEASAYQPWATSQSYLDYYAYYYQEYYHNSQSANLSGVYAQADWAVYNAISNGGNVAGLWRTPRQSEWEYLLKYRNASPLGNVSNARFIKAVVDTIGGLIIFPDVYTHPSDVPVPTEINNAYNINFNQNVYTLEQWAKIEAEGAVFIPAAGYRDGTTVSGVGSFGCYWTSTFYSYTEANDLYFNNYILYPDFHTGISVTRGLAVRPIADATILPAANVDLQQACNSYTWIDGNTYTASNNTATYTYTNVVGCDSVITLDLTINHSNTGTDIHTACDNYTWIDGNIYITGGDGIATYLTTNVAGCDSTVTLNLTLNHSNTGADVQTACDSYTWIDGVTYTASNSTATQTLTNAAGCDSVVTLNLTVNYSNIGTDVQTACDSYTWIDGNTYTASNNTATHTLTNTVGCDSVVTLNLTVNYSNTSTDVQTACDSFTWTNGITYTASETLASQTFTNAAGCDSVVTLNLTVNYSNTGTDIQTTCDSYTWIDGNTYTASNSTATQTLTNTAGCDSTVTLSLIVNYSNTGIDNQTACDSYTWIDGNTYTASNSTATHTMTNAAGCDSVVTLNLTVNYSNTGIETITACNSFVWHGTEYTNSTNAPTYTCPNTVGCDSVTTLHLTVNHCSTTIITACDSYTWNGSTYTASDTYFIGTDTLILIVNHSSTGTDVQNACDSYTWIDGVTYTASNSTATQTLTNAAGCDSVVTLNLTVYYSTASVDTHTACDSYTWLDGNTYSASNTTAIVTYTAANTVGCDSVVTLNLTVNYSSAVTETIVACDSYTWHGNTYTQSTSTPTDTALNTVGCDSITTLHLTVDTATHSTVHEQVVENQLPYTYHGTTFTNDTVSCQLVLVNARGCDSIVNYSLTVWRNVHTSASQTICDNQLPLTWNHCTFTSAGTQLDTLTTAHGADSIITMTLAVNPTYADTTAIGLCRNQLPYTWSDTNFGPTAQSGTYVRHFLSAQGCDSTRQLNLTVNETYSLDDSIVSCTPITWIDGNTYSSPIDGPQFTLHTAAGCDSTLTLHFQFHTPAETHITDSFCIGTAYLFHGRELTVGGLYTDTLATVDLCDSIIHLTLTQLNKPLVSINLSHDCDSRQYHLHANANVNYIEWNTSGNNWNNSWGSTHSADLTVSLQTATTFILYADYYETPTCPSTESITLTPLVQPTAVMQVTPDHLNFDLTTLTATDHSTGSTSRQWYVDNESYGNEITITASPDIRGDSVSLMLIAVNDLCVDTAFHVVPIYHAAVYAPNAFTPDLATNNTFSLKMNDIVEYELTIYSRSGLQVFHSTDPEEAWDGTSAGHACPQAAYVWIVTYTTTEQPRQPQTKRGTVTLLR